MVTVMLQSQVRSVSCEGCAPSVGFCCAALYIQSLVAQKWAPWTGSILTGASASLWALISLVIADFKPTKWWTLYLFIYLCILMVGLNQSCFSGVLYRQTVFFFSILFFPLCLFITSFFNHIKAHFKSVGGCTMTLSWDCRIFVPFLKKIPSNHSLTLSYVSLVCCFFINFPT